MLLSQLFEISQAQDLDGFNRYLLSIAEDLGFELVNAMLVIERPAGAAVYTIGNTPTAFLEAQNDAQAIARDPVVRRFKDLSVPFVYGQQTYVDAGAPDLWEEQAAFGYRCGMGVALHLPNQMHFTLGVDRAKPLPRSERQISRLLADLQFAAVHAQAAATRLMLPLMAGDPPKLSKREIEVLQWTKAGKTAWETGQILGLSEQGVQYHLSALIRKLGVVNKHQAVLEALAHGLLKP